MTWEVARPPLVRSKPDPAVRPNIDRIAVVGAGAMGAGIAHCLCSRGLPVMFSDIDPESVARGLRRIDRVFRGAVRRGLLTPTEARAP